MKQWKFYGRDDELRSLKNAMEVDFFCALAVFGGRGYGKTELLKEAAQRLPSDWTTVYMELPDATTVNKGTSEYKDNVRDIYYPFRVDFEQTRFGYLLKEFGFPEDGDGFFDTGFNSMYY